MKKSFANTKNGVAKTEAEEFKNRIIGKKDLGIYGSTLEVFGINQNDFIKFWDDKFKGRNHIEFYNELLEKYSDKIGNETEIIWEGSEIYDFRLGKLARIDYIASEILYKYTLRSEEEYIRWQKIRVIGQKKNATGFSKIAKRNIYLKYLTSQVYVLSL